MVKTNNYDSITNNATNTNNSSHTYTDILQLLNQQGFNPDELIFRFSCQQCGLRCCWNTGLETVKFLPYSFTYISEKIPSNVVKYYFETGMLKWEYSTHILPYVKIDFFVCPFLIFHFDRRIKDQFNELIRKKKDILDPTLQFFLLFVLNPLTMQYDDFLRKTKQEEATMGLPVHKLISKGRLAWKRFLEKYPSKLTGKSEHELMMGLFDFLRNIQGEKPQDFFTASCSIYPARPQVCRVHPLVRKSTFNGTKEIGSKDDKKVIINPHVTCPSIAFEKGKKITASQYLNHQRAYPDPELLFCEKIRNFLHLHIEIMRGLSKETLETFYQDLIRVLYITVDYIPDLKKFYVELEKKFDKFALTLDQLD